MKINETKTKHSKTEQVMTYLLFSIRDLNDATGYDSFSNRLLLLLFFEMTLIYNYKEDGDHTDLYVREHDHRALRSKYYCYT